MTKTRKFLLKIFCITYILELILLCRLMADVVLSTCYNMYHIRYTVNNFTWGLVFNHIVSCVALCILIYELLRLFMTNRSFARIEIKKRRTLAAEVFHFQLFGSTSSETQVVEEEDSESESEESEHVEPEAVVYSQEAKVTKDNKNEFYAEEQPKPQVGKRIRKKSNEGELVLEEEDGLFGAEETEGFLSNAGPNTGSEAVSTKK
jgi:hypothetical protein